MLHSSGGLSSTTLQSRHRASSVEAWHQLDVCDLGVFDATSFDGVVPFGGPRAAIRTIIATGDLTAETDPTSKHYCHMYRAAELRAFLEKPGVAVEQISASSALATGVENEFITAPEQWEALLEYEAVACVEPGYLDAGAHLLAAVRCDSLAALRNRAD